jgi:Fe-S cluster biogenesis protein NfuA
MEIQGRGPDRASIETILDRLRPGLIADGGNVELLDVGADGVVRVAFQGQCTTCPAQAATLRVAIEEPLRKEVPGISAVVSA